VRWRPSGAKAKRKITSRNAPKNGHIRNGHTRYYLRRVSQRQVGTVVDLYLCVILIVNCNVAAARIDGCDALAPQQRLPACYPYRHFVGDGGLMSYGPDGVPVYRQAASYVDRILRGAHAGDLPIQQPNAFELVINLQTAKAMDLTVPTWLLARADEVIA
jgi:ABC-type uncharacterized transport system substrate-binding protein